MRELLVRPRGQAAKTAPAVDTPYSMDDGGQPCGRALKTSTRVKIPAPLPMTTRGVRTTLSYQVFVAGAVTFLGLTLLTLLDIRRGFLFESYPVRTFFGVFTPNPRRHARCRTRRPACVLPRRQEPRAVRGREAHRWPDWPP